MSAGGFSHLDESGRAQMVDVGGKPATARTATAAGWVRTAPQTLARIREGGVAKGDVLTVARLAGIMGAKRTPDLIPLCHGLSLDTTEVTLTPAADDSGLEIRATCRTTAQTGVEMEALTAVSLAGLAVYDMCKAVDKGMVLTDIRLVHKSGGKSGTHEAA